MPSASSTASESASLLAGLQSAVPQLFQSSQLTLATHRKSINALHLLFLRSAALTATSEDGSRIRLIGEKMFGEQFRAALAYALGVRKGVEVVDRVVKFVAGFVGFALDFDMRKREERKASGMDVDEEDDDDEDDGPANRLVTQLLSFLLKGFKAKMKVARFRCVQLVALMINSLGELDDDSYLSLKRALLERVHDKEPTVRMQAVVALSKLQDADAADSGSDADEDSNNDEDEDDEDEEAAIWKKASVAEVLVDVLSHDPAPEVRRAALFNLLPTPSTLPSLLMRTLDLDPINRRATFAHVLLEIPIGGLSMAQREAVVGRGMRDRVAGVRNAAGRVVAKWANEVGGVLAFIEHFDLHEGTAIELALESIFEMQPELMDDIDFGDAFYASLTPSSALLARLYFIHLRRISSPLSADLEPTVTLLAFHTHQRWSILLDSIRGEGSAGGERDEEAERGGELVVRELVRVAEGVDYGDEIGRRRMFELMREMLSSSYLPATLIPACLDVLLKGTTERDFVRIVVELVQSLQADSEVVTSEEEPEDSDDSDEEVAIAMGKGRVSGKGVRGEERVQRRKELDFRCLTIVKALLERVMVALMENSAIHGMVHGLIVPSVRSKDPEIRSIGLICLGLCCLLDRDMATTSFRMIVQQAQEAEGAMRVTAVQTVLDLLVLYGTNFLAPTGLDSARIEPLLFDLLLQEEPAAGAAVVVGIAKLMLSGMVTNEDILSRMVILYFASETAGNEELRQCLSYFFPVYCYSSVANQRRMANVFLASIVDLQDMYENEADKASMIAPQQIGLQLVDWSDPLKAVSGELSPTDDLIHYDLAVDMVKMLYREVSKDVRKLICQLLPKLYIPDDVEDMRVNSLLSLIESLQQDCPLVDALSKNSLIRFQKSLIKVFGERIDALDAKEVRKSSEMVEVRAFIAKKDDDDDDEDEEEEEDAEEEEVEAGPEENDEDDEDGKGQDQAAPEEEAESDEDEDEEEEDEEK